MQEQLPRNAQQNHASGFMLERYLDNLTSYAETVYDTLSDNIDGRRGSENGSVKQQRSTSPTTRSSSIAGEGRITENNHAAGSIAPRPPEDREGKFEAPEEYLIPEQKAADLARETNVQGILRRFPTRRRRQRANGHDDVGQSMSLGPPEIAAAAESSVKPNSDNARRTIYVEYLHPRAETQHVEQSRAQDPPSTTNSSGIKGRREIMRERAAREASRDFAGISRSESDMSGSDSEIDGHIAEANSLRSDPQKQISDVSQTKNVYRRQPREPVRVENLSPGTNQNQSDGNAPPQPRSATLKAKSLGYGFRARVLERVAQEKALREANDSRERGVDGGNVSDMSTTPSAGSMDIKAVSLKDLFSISTTSTKPMHAIHADIMRTLNQLGVKFTVIRGGFSCRHVPSIDLKKVVDLPAAGYRRRRRISSRRFTESRDLNHSDSDVGPINSDISQNIGRTSVSSELGGSMILEFDIFVVKVPLLSLHGIQFKRLAGGAWQYKNMADNILTKRRQCVGWI